MTLSSKVRSLVPKSNFSEYVLRFLKNNFRNNNHTWEVLTCAKCILRSVFTVKFTKYRTCARESPGPHEQHSWEWTGFFIFVVTPDLLKAYRSAQLKLDWRFGGGGKEKGKRPKKGKGKARRDMKGNGKWWQPLLRSNSTKQPNHAYARTNETKRLPGWTHPQPPI